MMIDDEDTCRQAGQEMYHVTFLLFTVTRFNVLG